MTREQGNESFSALRRSTKLFFIGEGQPSPRDCYATGVVLEKLFKQHKPRRNKAEKDKHRPRDVQKPSKLRVRNGITDPKQLIAHSTSYGPLGIFGTGDKENAQHTGQGANHHLYQ